MPQSKRQCQVGSDLPLILDVVFKLVVFEMPAQRSAIAKQGTGGRTRDQVIVLIGNLRDGADQIAVCHLIRVLKALIQRR